MALNIKITDAGLAEIVNADNMGTGPVVITEIGVGNGQYEHDVNQTELVSEVKRLSTFGGGIVSDDTIHVAIRDESTDEYSLGEFGLFSDSGTLIAVYSQTAVEGFILEKSAATTLLLPVDIKLTQINAASLSFGDINFVNPQATETTAGVAKIATEEMMNQGEDDSSMATPKKVSDYAAPLDHDHSWGQIWGKPSTFPPASHNHSWGQISGKPSTFPPASHNHSWHQISGKPRVVNGVRFGSDTSFGGNNGVYYAGSGYVMSGYYVKADHDDSIESGRRKPLQITTNNGASWWTVSGGR